tara:strand:+ start:1089 stop:2168 length:1080 start_codon:yes stop_codon:yes gene_type:complete
MSVKRFSRTKLFDYNEKELELYKIANSLGIEIDILNYGARISSLKIPTKFSSNSYEDVVLGFDSYNKYFNDVDYINAIVGRVANRIANSHFVIGNQKFSVSSNEGKNHLHGGFQGFDSKVWNFIKFIEESDFIGLRLSMMSPHLDEGYPGNLEVTVDFLLSEDNRLIIKTNALSDQDTVVSITNHNYWNFNGHADHYADISNHFLNIPSNLICMKNEDNLPNGNFSSALDSPYDFTIPRQLNDSFLHKDGIDHNYCFHHTDDSNCSAELYSPSTGLGATIVSDLPGLQCYTGNQMQASYDGKYGRSYGPYFGICLEPQFYPDAINQDKFLSPLLLANHNYQKTISISFRNDYPLDSSRR